MAEKDSEQKELTSTQQLNELTENSEETTENTSNEETGKLYEFL